MLFYRTKCFQEEKLNVPRDNMYNLVSENQWNYIDPLYQLMKKDLLSKRVICADETTTQVLNEQDKDPHTTSYLWQISKPL